MTLSQSHNPDVLTCLANLSNDEVFTPPSFVNQILDELPAALWSNPRATFLDPFTKTGVFLREIAKRLNGGLKDQFPDDEERLNHILSNQIYGIALTELTALLARRSLYCSKLADGQYSICSVFGNEAGNIRYENRSHTWKKDKCLFCGASKEVFDRPPDLESYAYLLIHEQKPEELFPMKFDVIVGNPPYQLADAGHGTSATPIYHRFVEQAIRMNPRYLSMVIPARWYSGGKGMDEFRKKLLNDARIRHIRDIPEASECFPGVQIKGGVCYFVWERDNPGLCTVENFSGGHVTSVSDRPLLEEGCETFIRFNQAIPILKKVQAKLGKTLVHKVSSRKPFGLDTQFKGTSKPTPDSLKVHRNGGTGHIGRDQIKSGLEYIDKFKVFIPPLGSGSDKFPHPILGTPFVGNPGEISSETYLAVGPFETKAQAENCKLYLQSRFLRFLVLLNKPSQHATRKVYSFVPDQDFEVATNDIELFASYGITVEEQDFISTLVR